jgi:hypothetical protein
MYDVRQTQLHTYQPLVLELSSFEVEIAIKKLKIYTLPSTDEIPVELIQAEDKTLCSEIHKLINSILIKEELPQQWKESVIVCIYKRGNKTVCSNCRGTSLLSTTYKILSSILVSGLTVCIGEIIGYHQCRF